MSEALEALEQAELALSFALSSTGHAQCRDDVKKAQEAHKAIRAALEQGEAVGSVEVDGRGHSMLRYDYHACARLGEGIHDLYTAPPSTAEAQARALEDAADCGEFSAWAKDRLLKMAKRIREEG